NRADKNSVRPRRARIDIKDGRPYLDLVVETPKGLVRCRYDDLSATDLWVAYHVIRPSKAMRSEFKLSGLECNLLGCEVDSMGIEGKFAIHPALADTDLAWYAQRLDVLMAAGAPDLFDDGGLGKSPMQWYDESALLRVEKARLVVEAAKGPPDI